MNSRKHTPAFFRDRESLYTGLLFLLFLFSVSSSLFVTFFATARLLDGDASAELILSRHLHETGQILSKDWYYSTELRVLNTQLVFAPLFGLFRNWHIVRYVGTIVLQFLLICSYGLFCRAAGLARRAFFLGSALLLLPFSVSYGRNVLYQTFYIPHIALSFAIVGLFLIAVDCTAMGSGNAKKIAAAGAMLLLSFLSGMGGIRQLLTTHAPLFLLSVLYMWENRQTMRAKEISVFIRLLLMLILSFLCGYAINNRLIEIYSFRDYSETQLNWHMELLPELLFSIAHFFGYRRNVPAFSLIGFFSLAGLLAAVIYTGYSVRSFRVRISRMQSGRSFSRFTVRFLFPVSLIVIFLTVLLIDKANQPVRYVIPFLIWVVPDLCTSLEALPKKDLFSHLRRPALAGLVVSALLANGIFNMFFFVRPEKIEQPYEGSVYQESSTVQALKPVVDLIINDKYDLGYSTFWYGGVITEMTDGAIPVINILLAKDGTLTYRDWLCLDSYRKIKPKKSFILIKKDSLKYFEKSEIRAHCTPVYKDPDQSFTVFHLDQPQYIYTKLKS